MLRHAKESLEYLPAFKGLREEEMDLLFTLASNRERGVIALKRVARFLLRERYLHGIPRNADANALLVLAEFLLRLDPVGGRSRIDTGTFSHHRALSAWWWSATLKNIRLTSDPASVREQADQLEAWLRAGASPGDDPPVIANANQLLGRQDGMARAGYRNKNHPLGQLVRSVLWRVEPVDFVTGEPMIGMKLIESSGVSRDDQQRVEREQEHHVFPRSWLKRNPSVRDGHDVDQIANIALISEATNSWISNRPPRKYVGDLDTRFGRSHVDRVLASHLLDGELLRHDCFAEQIQTRSNSLADAARRLLDPRELNLVAGLSAGSPSVSLAAVERTATS